MGEYTLIVTEKPDAARRIASALDLTERPKQLTENGVPYYMAKRERQIVVVPSLGHLYTVAAEKNGRSWYPVFEFKWVPRHVAERTAKHTRSFIQTITKLARNADTFIDACDYDTEGSIIGYCILKYACNNKEQQSKRMKYSTLTKQELEKSYTEPLPHLDFALIEAGRTRHEVDWLYGINLSRALTTAAKNSTGRYATLSTGRVQGPLLKFLVTREKTIQSFVPTPYWQIKAHLNIDNRLLEAEYDQQKIQNKKEADTIISQCRDKKAEVKKVQAKQFLQPPPIPFDLGSLQAESYRLFRYTPKQTLTTAQRLYLDALISYPRTSSQKLPPAIDYRTILRNLGKTQEFTKLTTELLTKPVIRPYEGNKEDPAHPAIYPTGNRAERALSSSERNIWSLIVRRFLAVFADPATRQTVKVDFAVNIHTFHLHGSSTLSEGWIRFYKPYARFEEAALPPLKEGQTVDVERVLLIDKFTQPPPRYNPSSLLRKMEKSQIGTKATRADMIQTLQDRKYVQNDQMKVTDLGFQVAETLQQHCPKVTSIRLTRELEDRMDKIHTGTEKREEVLSDTIRTLEPILEQLERNEEEIGEQLRKALNRSALEERTIGPCPTCKTGKLVVLRSKKTGKRFVGCTNYFENLCKTSFPLPQKGSVKPLGRSCRRCGWPTIQVRTTRRPWTLCLNPKCPSKQHRGKPVEMPSVQ
jgi:DNA topoisomerase-1